MEHWRYSDGYDLGWRDSREFFGARINQLVPSILTASSSSAQTNDNTPVGADFIGALDLWILKRMREAGVTDRGRCLFGWEFEHGFRRAVRDFASVVQG